jgi:hypothetical protein
MPLHPPQKSSAATAPTGALPRRRFGRNVQVSQSPQKTETGDEAGRSSGSSSWAKGRSGLPRLRSAKPRIVAGLRAWRPQDLSPRTASPTVALTRFATPYAAMAPRAGLPTFTVARRMGTSVEMIDKTYGHLAHDTEEWELRTARSLRQRHRWTHGGRTGSDRMTPDAPQTQAGNEALCRTRTDDPLLTMEVLYQLS